MEDAEMPQLGLRYKRDGEMGRMCLTGTESVKDNWNWEAFGPVLAKRDLEGCSSVWDL